MLILNFNRKILHVDILSLFFIIKFSEKILNFFLYNQTDTPPSLDLALSKRTAFRKDQYSI